jgi:hypothetical protein
MSGVPIQPGDQEKLKVVFEERLGLRSGTRASQRAACANTLERTTREARVSPSRAERFPIFPGP